MSSNLVTNTSATDSILEYLTHYRDMGDKVGDDDVTAQNNADAHVPSDSDLQDLERHAVELANLAIHFDSIDNLPAASYYYQVRMKLPSFP